MTALVKTEDGTKQMGHSEKNATNVYSKFLLYAATFHLKKLRLPWCSPEGRQMGGPCAEF